MKNNTHVAVLVDVKFIPQVVQVFHKVSLNSRGVTESINRALRGALYTEETIDLNGFRVVLVGEKLNKTFSERLHGFHNLLMSLHFYRCQNDLPIPVLQRTKPASSSLTSGLASLLLESFTERITRSSLTS